jgi:hypothetical protein
MQLVNTKAGRAVDFEDLEVLSYFPAKIQVGKRSGRPLSIPTLQYFLNMTRHTPRDLLRIFEDIRKVEASGTYPASGDHLSDEVVREGVLQYSTKYFVGAIQNEFAGYEGGPEVAAQALTALKNIGKQRFDRQEFHNALGEVLGAESETTDQLLRLLFFAGAIGNSIGQTGKAYMQFYHRRDESEIYLKGVFILHNALIHAWGMRRTAQPQVRNPSPTRQKKRRVTRGGRPPGPPA